MLTLINTQPPEKVQRDPNGMLGVHSIFQTIQGEGPFAGEAALFIRLHGCNLQCPGCDTDYTSKVEVTSPQHLLELLPSFYDWPSVPERPLLVVITGGEPFRQNITPLVNLLLDNWYQVQIETNGVLYPGDDFPWEDEFLTVVCSPKTGKIHPETATKIHAYKYVLSWGGVHPDGLPVSALGHALGGFKTVARPPVGWEGPVYLQPMDTKDPIENQANVNAVVQSVMKHRKYIMGVQMHKLTGLP